MKVYIVFIQDLLIGRNEEFDNADKKRIRLIRHKDNRKEKLIDGKKYSNSLFDLYLNEHDVFLSYQSEQVEKRFKDVDYIVSFIGEEGISSRFVGVRLTITLSHSNPFAWCTVIYLLFSEKTSVNSLYARVKYNKPEELFEVVNDALNQENFDEKSPISMVKE